MRGVMVILLALMLTGQAWAAIDTWQFKDEAQEQAFREITSQLRCPKCQNNSIADSNAMIAADMRQKVYELMQQGKTKGQIVDYIDIITLHLAHGFMTALFCCLVSLS